MNFDHELNRRSLFLKAASLGAGAAAMLALPETAAAQIAPQAAPQGPPTQSNPMEWIATTPTEPWKTKTSAPSGGRGGGGGLAGTSRDLDVLIDSPAQTIEGFGTCFNELGWTSLQALSVDDRESILREMFAPVTGANFTLCRMPVGANDFSRDWYSYDETEGDFALEHFSIANDLETLVPFIKNARKYNPALRLWASPWSPPAWMKRNKNYAGRAARPSGQNGPGGPPPVTSGPEFDLFIQDERYFKTYAAYFGRFIDAYKQQGIPIEMVMPQNEFNSAQNFPSCTWNPESLAQFVRYLGPEMTSRQVRIFFGTLERASLQMLDTVLNDAQAGKYIQGVGVQWAGKGAIAAIQQKHPGMQIYQSEQECGDGKNEWSYCSYCWDLMKHYMKNGATGYMYWNTSLESGASSHWGWKQNSLVSVDVPAKTYRFNHEYYLMKHVSHFVQPAARRLNTQGTFDNALAFVNPDKSIAVVLRNESGSDKSVNVTAGASRARLSMEADSINTILLNRPA